MKLYIVCNKDADIEMFFSNRLTVRDAIYDGVSGTGKKVTAKGQQEKEAEISLICRGFGTKAGETWVQLTALESKKSKGETLHFLSVSAVEGMTCASSCR